MILKEISVYKEKFNNYLPKETKIVLHYQNIEAVEDEDRITINTGKNSTAYKVFDLNEGIKSTLKMKLTSYEGETKVLKVDINKIHFNMAGDLAVKLEFKVLKTMAGGAVSELGFYSLL
ncbi:MULTISPECIES: hypothetical protein [Bacillus amyloliquefaciens group]|uniref:hypothetical protein n=1 Tax=Bacillus amyloliquefaciens group TaxID=1938374 RepID=UPI0015F11B3F|nr:MULTISPECIES: hypothetical protein [Bacillus amyloliquefaciens group]MED0754699.1 hypothetical protein [Bacillus amyloliquefaciens]QMI88342.1 hypothetical protein H1Q60_19890 [Bacillus velezensis]